MSVKYVLYIHIYISVVGKQKTKNFYKSTILTGCPQIAL